METAYTEFLKIGISFLLGAILGLEREYHNKSAGFRTIIMITVGATLFSIISYKINSGTPDRIAANIITGIGFIGAGVIFKEGLKVGGITTAATIWVAAAIGMAVGFGEYWLAAGVTLVVLLTLILLSKAELVFDRLWQSREYKISFFFHQYSTQQFEENLLQLKIKFSKTKVAKAGDRIIVYYKIAGNKYAYESLNTYLLQNESISGFEM